MTPRRPLLLALALLAAPAWGQAPAEPPPLVDVGLAAATAPIPLGTRVEQAAQSLAVMQSTIDQATGRLEAAREAKDIVQVNCVTGKLAALEGLLGVARQARESLDEAAARSDRPLVEHAFAQIGIARARVESFRVQVEGCVGETSQYTGDTRLQLEVDPALRRDDPSRAEAQPAFLPVSTARPPAVSGSQ